MLSAKRKLNKIMKLKTIQMYQSKGKLNKGLVLWEATNKGLNVLFLTKCAADFSDKFFPGTNAWLLFCSAAHMVLVFSILVD